VEVEEEEEVEVEVEEAEEAAEVVEEAEAEEVVEEEGAEEEAAGVAGALARSRASAKTSVTPRRTSSIWADVSAPCATRPPAYFAKVDCCAAILAHIAGCVKAGLSFSWWPFLR